MAFDTIQGAIDAAVAGDTVRVCPGNYKELLTIDATKDHLSLVSVGTYEAHVIRPRNANGSALLHIEHGANHVLVKGLALIFPTNRTNCDGSSVVAIQSDGRFASIVGNRIVARDGDPNWSNCGYFAGIVVGQSLGTTTAMQTATARAAAGTGAPRAASSARPAASPPASAEIEYNIIHDFQAFAIAAGGQNTSMEATGNSVHFGHVGATDCSTTTTASSASWRSFSPAGTFVVCFSFGIVLVGGATGTIENNVVLSDNALGSAPARPAGTGTTPFMGFGILTDFGDAAGDFLIRGNHVAFNVFGIVASSAGHGVVRNNEVGYSLDAGIDLVGSGVKVAKNALYQADLVAASESSGNLIRHNTVDKGQCDDQSTGPGTGGTANTWKGNTAEFGSNPPQICPQPAQAKN
jgi:hypothetical protein